MSHPLCPINERSGKGIFKSSRCPSCLLSFLSLGAVFRTRALVFSLCKKATLADWTTGQIGGPAALSASDCHGPCHSCLTPFTPCGLSLPCLACLCLQILARQARLPTRIKQGTSPFLLDDSFKVRFGPSAKIAPFTCVQYK